MRRYIYAASLGCRNARRRSHQYSGLCLVFAAAAALAVVADAAAAGAERNALKAFELRSGGAAYVRGLERTKALGSTEAGRYHLAAMSRDDELARFAAALPPGSVTRRRSDFRARLVTGGRSAAAIVRGLDMDAERDALSRLALVSGSIDAAAKGIVVESKAAKALGADVGDEVEIEATDYHGRATAWSCPVAAVYKDDPLLEDGSAWLDIATANAILGYGPGEFGYFSITTPESNRDLSDVENDLGRALPKGSGLVRWRRSGLEPMAWDDIASRVKGIDWKGRGYLVATIDDCMVYPLRALAAADAAAKVLIALIVALAAVGAASSFRTVTRERRKEIGALKALGATGLDIARMTYWEALAAALASGAAGVAAGCALVGIAAAMRFPAAGDLALFLDGGALSPIIRPGAGLVAVAATALAAALGSLGPARSAARLQSAEAFGEGI